MISDSKMPDLHHKLCTNRPEDVDRMKKLFKKWRGVSQEVLNGALEEAVKAGHEVCVDFLYNFGATGNIRDFLKCAATQSHSALFEILLKKGCTQDDVFCSVNFLKGELFADIPTALHINVSILRHIVNHGFKFENYDFLFDPNIPIHPNIPGLNLGIVPDEGVNFRLRLRRLNDRLNIPRLLLPHVIIDDLYPLTTRNKFRENCLSNSWSLKIFALNGAVVDYRQLLPRAQTLPPERRDHLSLLQTFIQTQFKSCVHKQHTRQYYFECLRILRQCGANFSEVNSEGKTALDLIEDKKAEDRDPFNPFRPVPFDEILNIVRFFSNEPLSLKSLSRLSLMRHLKHSYVKRVSFLNPEQFPRDVIGFLKGEDMTVTLPENSTEFFNFKRKVEQYAPHIRTIDYPSTQSDHVSVTDLMSSLESLYYPRLVPTMMKERLETLERCIHERLNILYQI